MTAWLQLTDDQRRATLVQAQQLTGINLKALEKDWWVTVVLKALFGSAHAKYMVFKGGTSLSKGFKLISRFSEDIDIALAPEAFGMEYKKEPSKSYRTKLKKAGCKFTSETLKDELAAQLIALGVPQQLFTVVAKPVLENMPDTDPQTLFVKYVSLYEPSPYVADEVRIEVSVRSLKTPFTTRPILSILSEVNPNDAAYPEQPFNVTIVEPRKTMLEKLFLLHEEFGKQDRDKIRVERMSRHIYDLVMNAEADPITEALTDHDLYDALITHRKAYMNISWVDYTTLDHSTLWVLPPEDLIERFRVDYDSMMESMIYGDPPSFDELLQGLGKLQARFRLKKDVKPVAEIMEKSLLQIADLDGDTVSTTVVYTKNSEIPDQPDNVTVSYRVTYRKRNGAFHLENINVMTHHS